MTVTAPPPVPNPADPTTFNPYATAFVAWFPTLVDDLNVYAGMTNSGRFTDGSAAGAGITFALDTNTGLFRPAADQIGLTTGGVQRALLSSAALQVDVPITGTAVVSSATDTTSGRLMNVGAHGIGLLGTAGNVTDIDSTAIAGGLRRYSSGSAGTFPAGVTAAAGGVLLIIRETASKATMFLSPAGTNDTFIRSLSTTWGPWSKLIMVDASVAPTAGQILRQNDANTAVAWAPNITGSATVNAATGSPTAIDFTGIPSWARRVTVMLSGCSTSGTSAFILQGGAGSVDATSYTGYLQDFEHGSSAVPVSVTSTAGFPLVSPRTATSIFTVVANMTLLNPATNLWCVQVSGSGGTSPRQAIFGSGSKAFSGALDRIRLTTAGGSDTFDAGSVSIIWE